MRDAISRPFPSDRKPSTGFKLLTLPAVAALALSLAGCTGTSLIDVAPRPAASPSSSVAAEPLDPDAVPILRDSTKYAAPHAAPAAGTKAADVLAALPVKGRAPKTGYSRDQFGQAWADVDHNGCDTRNDVLKLDLTGVDFVSGSRCKVQSGTLADPYTGRTIQFLRGASTSSAVQIDHIVPLSDAWQTGAQQLSIEQRTALANEPLNLQATDGPTNTQKSDSDAATWLPSNKAYRCDYVARQVTVKATYNLWVTQGEHDAIAGILASCPNELVPAVQKPVAAQR